MDLRAVTFAAIDKRFGVQPAQPKCLCCSSTSGVELESSRTQYHFTGLIGGPEDPNRPVLLCRPCAQKHHQQWDSMWADYRAGLL